MELRPGYKQTEVGVIPADWTVTTVGEIAEVKTGPFGTALHEKDYVDHGTPIITVEHLGESAITYQNLPLVSDADRLRLRAYTLRQGDIVFSRVGSVDRNALITPAEDGWLFSGRLLRVRPAPEQVHSPYLSHHFHSEAFKRRVRNVSVGQTMASINTEILRGVEAVLPPTKAEQEAIAEALIDADALVESLEQLLAKKRQLKQGALQELLTGKKRLPGFSGEWGNVRLRDLLSYERPDKYIVQDTEYLERGDIPVLTANKSFLLGYTVEGFGICGDLPAIVFDDFTTASKYVDFPFKVKSSAIKLLRPKHDRVNLKFVFDRMQLIRFSLGDHKRYYISEFQNLEVAAPDHAEQQAITTILSDMDAEIAALSAKLAKARQLKQGMMQELLTGRIRLV